MELTVPTELAPELRAQLQKELVEPAAEFLSRSSKQVRRQLVVAGYCWVTGLGEEDFFCEKCTRLGEALELIHSASLIIDDIQDHSPVRRGAASMHIKIGTAKAINLANWLYFKGFEKVDQLEVDDAKKVILQRIFHQALIGGHFGQALDLSFTMTKVPKGQASEICDASVRLKTGALTGLAFASGSVLAGAKGEDVVRSLKIGEEIGVVLQNLDDLKNLKSDPLTPAKQFEDFKNQRPSLIWTIASKIEDASCWNKLLAAVEALPDCKLIRLWLSEYAIEEKAKEFVKISINEFLQTNKKQDSVSKVIQQLVGAYESL